MGTSTRGSPGNPPGAKFPPLYSTLLALYWSWTGGDVEGVARLAVATNLLSLVAMGVALAWFARVRLGLPPLWSAGCGVLVGLLTTPWRYALVPLSDAPGLLLLVLLVGAATRMEQAPLGKRGRATLWFLLLFFVAFHLRTALLVVGVAGVLGSLARRGEGEGAAGLRRGVMPAVGVVVLSLPWFLLSRMWTARMPLEFRDILGGYGAWLGRLAEAGGGPMQGLERRFPRVVEEVGQALVPGVPHSVRWLLLILLFPLLWLGIGALWKHSRSAVLAVALLALQIVLWPFVDERMVLPLLPWLVLALVAGAHRAMASPPTSLPRPLQAVLPPLTPALLAAWISVLGVSLGILAARPAGVAAPGALARGVVLGEVVEAIEPRVAPGSVVGAPEFWAILHLRTGRPVVPSTRFRPGMGLEAVGTPAEQHRQWAVGRVTALVDEGGLHRGALSALADVCGDGAWQVVEEGAGFRLVLLTWDLSCRRKVIPGWQETDRE